MKKKKQNTFFTEDIYKTEIALDVNEDVLKRIYNFKITGDSNLPIEFFFVSNNIDNVLNLQEHLKENFAGYKQFKIQLYENLYELSGLTSSIRMALDSINRWNQSMWDLGYDFDCKLDGWQAGH